MKRDPLPLDSKRQELLLESLPEDLVREIDQLTSVDQCLTLARLYLHRAKELSHQNPGMLEG